MDQSQPKGWGQQSQVSRTSDESPDEGKESSLICSLSELGIEETPEALPFYHPSEDEPNYNADTEQMPVQFSEILRYSHTPRYPNTPDQAELPSLSNWELFELLENIYHKQDHNGILVSHPYFLRHYIPPEKLSEAYDLEKADDLLREYVAMHIDQLFTKEDPVQTLGPIYRDEDGKKRFVIVWSGLQEPKLPGVLADCSYITYVSQDELSYLETDIDFSWMRS